MPTKRLGSSPNPSRVRKILDLIRTEIKSRQPCVDLFGTSVCCYHRPDVPVVRTLLRENGFADVGVWFGGMPGIGPIKEARRHESSKRPSGLPSVPQLRTA